MPHDPKYHFLTQINTNYDPNAKCPNIDQAMRNIFTEKQIEGEKEWLGFCLTSGYKHKLISIYSGETNSGKSTFFNIISKMFGADNISGLEPQDLSKEFYLHSLCGKMLNIAGDVGAHTIERFNKIKMITGGDSVLVNEKSKPLFEMRNSAKIIWACNRMPRFDEASAATFGRLRQVDCSKVIDPKEMNNFDINDYTTDEELSGLLNHALGGLKRLNKRGCFDLPSIDERMENHEREANGFFNWAEELLDFTRVKQDWIAADDLYKSYVRWCKDHKVNIILTQRMFIADFKKTHYRKFLKYAKKTVDTKQIYGIYGVKWFNGDETVAQEIEGFLDGK